MKNNNGIVCVIPSRSQGDQINNLNFLQVGDKMLLELTILSALKSKIFSIIYVIFDNEDLKSFFEKKYKIKGIINKRKNLDFTKLVKKYKKNYFDTFSYICVLFPNSPFKNEKTLIKMYSKIKKEKIDFLISGCFEKNKFYFNNKNILKKNYYRKHNKLDKVFYISGGINFFSKKFNNYENYTNKINKKNFFLLNNHEGFSIYSLYDLILASTINDIDYSIFNNLLKNK